MIPAFCWTWTIVIVFLHTFIQPIISVLTFLKGTLFTGTVKQFSLDFCFDNECSLYLQVVVTLLVGLKIQNPVKNDYTAMGDSFLMSTIALGGLMNVMPLMFSKLKQTRDEVNHFRVIFLLLRNCLFSRSLVLTSLYFLA